MKKDKNWKCEKCGSSNFMESCVGTTAAYYKPVYKDGVNVNPDKNRTDYERVCLDCNSVWSVSYVLGKVTRNELCGRCKHGAIVYE